MSETEAWVRDILRRDPHLFYVSSRWLAVAGKVRRERHNECERCRAKGIYAPCEAVHHKQRLRQRPDLALDPGNLECLCSSCHWEEHHSGLPKGFWQPERW